MALIDTDPHRKIDRNTHVVELRFMARAPTRKRNTDRLRLGRKSNAGALYFVTCVTAFRHPWLGSETNRIAIVELCEKLHETEGGDILAAGVMPDHVHLIVRLDGVLTVGRWMARFKSQARQCTGYAGRWQRDFWEHRLKESESLEDYGLYVYLNPYRAGLLHQNQAWLGWWVSETAFFRFAGSLRDGVAPSAWFEDDIARFDELKTGE